MIGDRVCSSGLSALCSGAVLACPVRSVVGVEGRGDTRIAARGRCAATKQSEASPVLAGSRGPGRACPDASEGATRPPDCHAGNVVALAPQADRHAVAAAEAAGPSADRRGAGRPDRAPGEGEPDLGCGSHPGRTASPRPSGRRLDHPQDPACQQGPAIHAPRRHLAHLPARPGRQPACDRLLPRRHRDAEAVVCRVRHRDQDTQGPPARHYRASDRGLGGSAGPQSCR